MRLFIAIPLPGDITRKVSAYEQELIDGGITGRFVPHRNQHVTLRFIGECSPNALSDIASAMHDAVRDARPFTLKLGGYGRFTHGGGLTGYIAVEGNPELTRLHETLESALSDRGLGRGRGRLQPHITLGRSLSADPDGSLVPPKGDFRVTSIVLYESTLEKGRMVYTPLHTEKF